MGLIQSSYPLSYRKGTALDDLDNFLKFSLVESQCIVNCVKFLLTSDKFHEIYIKFLRDSSNCKEGQLLSDLQNLASMVSRRDIYQEFEPTSVAEYLQDVIDKYSDVDEFSSLGILLEDLSYVSSMDEDITFHSIMKSIKFVENEIAILLAISHFKLFIYSAYYLEWRSYEALKIKHFRELHGVCNNDCDMFSNIMVVLPERNEITPPPDDFFGRSLWHVDPNEMSKVIKYSWMCYFLAIAEISPISISIASATEERRGFPLIYVNEYFKLLSGYDRDEVIGLNCKFLQKNEMNHNIPQTKNDIKNIKKLSQAIKCGKKIKTIILNCKKNGELFKNFICIKPIFDIKGNYVFVIGIQANVNDKFQMNLITKYIDKIFRFLPDRL